MSAPDALNKNINDEKQCNNHFDCHSCLAESPMGISSPINLLLPTTISSFGWSR